MGFTVIPRRWHNGQIHVGHWSASAFPNIEPSVLYQIRSTFWYISQSIIRPKHRTEGTRKKERENRKETEHKTESKNRYETRSVDCKTDGRNCWLISEAFWLFHHFCLLSLCWSALYSSHFCSFKHTQNEYKSPSNTAGIESVPRGIARVRDIRSWSPEFVASLWNTNTDSTQNDIAKHWTMDNGHRTVSGYIVNEWMFAMKQFQTVTHGVHSTTFSEWYSHRNTGSESVWTLNFGDYIIDFGDSFVHNESFVLFELFIGSFYFLFRPSVLDILSLKRIHNQLIRLKDICLVPQSICYVFPSVFSARRTSIIISSRW